MNAIREMVEAVPGIYPGMPFAQYVRLEAWNASSIKEVERSVKHARHALTNESGKETEALRKGRLLHVLVLEPDRLSNVAQLGPINVKTGRCFGFETQAWRDEEEAAARQGVMLYTTEMLNECQEMAIAIRKHPVSSEVLYSGARVSREVVIVWDEPVELEARTVMLRCKARIDALWTDIGLVWDIKSAMDGSPAAFNRAIANYGYHMAAHHYSRGAERVVWGGKKDAQFSWIVVESEDPHGVAVYTMDDNWAAIGKTIWTERLRRIAKACESGLWSGYGDKVHTLTPPAYVMSRFSDGD